MNNLLDLLSDEYELRLFTFGEGIKSIDGNSFDTLEFDEKLTDIAALYDLMDVRFSNRNVGALIIASDGIYNKGMNPLYQSSSMDCPIYTISLGDTMTRSDAYLKRVLYNRIAFEGNDFPVEMIVNANKLNGATINIKLTEYGRQLISRQIPVQGDNFSRTIRMNITAGDPGMHHYVLHISSNKEELTRENNRYDLFVDILKSKQKVLILANSPHPDISAIKSAISSNVNYEVEEALINDFQGPLAGYSLVILHQMPSQIPSSSGMVNRLTREKIPLLYVLGPQSDLITFNRQNSGMLVNAYNRAGTNESLPVINEEFTFFSLSDELKQLIPEYPPLFTHFARYNVANSTEVLLYQKIGNIESSDPLLLFQQGVDVKIGVLAGTGLWKWRMKTWQETGRHDVFNELVNKTVQFLSLKEDQRRFKVNTIENIAENTPLEFEAELYNESFESVNAPDVSLEITDDEGNKYEYVFSRTAQAYSLNAGTFPVGTYTYNSSCRLGNEVFADIGGFTVMPVVAEKLSLRAEHTILEALATENDGRMIAVADLDSLPQILMERGDIKPLIHSEKKFTELIDIWWVLVVILALLGAEWFLRKWSGSY